LKKGIRIEKIITKEELIQLYLKHIHPQPQRERKTRNKQMPAIYSASNSSRIKSTKVEINVSPTKKIILKRTLLTHSSQVTPHETILEPSMEDETNSELACRENTTASTKTEINVSPTKKMILKRTLLTHSSQTAPYETILDPSVEDEINDEIKKAKLN
jgi:hypothetical protein